MPTFVKPEAAEYPPYAAAYIGRTPAEVSPDTLRQGMEELLELIEPLTDQQLLLRYAADKWTLKELLVHLIDAERVIAYRLLRIARHDSTPLPGFDHDSFNTYAYANERTKAGILSEYRAVRQATITLLENLREETATFTGVASGHPITVRALAHFIAGHELHHLAIMRERYWPSLEA